MFNPDNKKSLSMSVQQGLIMFNQKQQSMVQDMQHQPVGERKKLKGAAFFLCSGAAGVFAGELRNSIVRENSLLLLRVSH